MKALRHALYGAVSAVGAFLAQTRRETRVIAVEALGLSLSLTGVAQFNVPVALILGGLVIILAAEVRSGVIVPAEQPQGQ